MNTELLIEMGQHMVTGFPGTEMPQEFINIVKRAKIGNVILFTHNIESLPQVHKLCRDIDELITSETGHHPFITIDQEGGMVSRLPETAPVLPGQMALSSVGDESIIENGTYMNGVLLQKVGCNFNLAPSVDVNENPKNPVIGVRSFGDDAKKVAEHGASAIKGYNRSGIISCAKHFPGHGDTALDSHLSLPMIDKSMEELQKQLLPFRRAIAEKVPAVMTSHILFPQIEKENIPCTMSRTMLSGLLREELGFTGLILTDCMEMKAIGKYYGTTEGCVKSLQAGADLIFISHHADLAEKTVYELCRKKEDGLYDEEELKASLERIYEYKKNLKPIAEIKDWSEFDCMTSSFNETARSSSVTIKAAENVDLDNLVFIAPRAFITSNVSDQIDRNDFATWMQKEFPGSEKVICTADPKEDEIKEIVEGIQNGKTVAFGTYNAHLQTGQLEIIKALHEKGIPVHLFILRNPYDAMKSIVDIVDSCTLTFEYSVRMFERCRDILKGNVVSTGTLPIKLEI